MLQKFGKIGDKDEFYSTKKHLLYNLGTTTDLFKGNKGRKVLREIIVVINEHKQHESDYRDRLPDFSTIRPQDVSILLQEIAERQMGFGELDFFKPLPKSLWGSYFELMQKVVYLKGHRIHEKGVKSDNFYVIKSGSVWFLSNEEGAKDMPFMEVDSYFGEFELFDQLKRRYSVVAKKVTVVYVLKRVDFLNTIMQDIQIRTQFEEETKKRIFEFERADRACGREIRRKQRAS